MADRLAEGRRHYREQAWRDAWLALRSADEASPLKADDLECLANAAYLAGEEADFLVFLERTHRLHLTANDWSRAARCAFWLGLVLIFRGERGQASGWLARANRLVDGLDCVEHGYLDLPRAEGYLAAADTEAAHEAASAAVAVGERFGDTDLVACARHLQGRALIRQGERQAGLSLLDEVMLAVVGGELSAIVTGLIYCSVIDTCRTVFAMNHAREWTEALSRWCDRQPGLMAFTGTCLVHRAEILQFHGDWTDAMREAGRACERFAAGGEDAPAAPAFYQKGEVHRLRGEYSAAEHAYRRSARLGREPQPGLALLRMMQGKMEVARASISRLLDTVDDPLRRAGLLPAWVEIVLAAGDIRAAQDASRELETIAGTLDAEVLQATALQARGAVALAAGDARSALDSLRQAVEIWQRIQVPYEAARTRQLIGRACQALGDREGGALELAAARAIFERLGAVPDLHAPPAHRERGPAGNDYGLTPRECQVLRLVAEGRTNKAIAAELRLSGRTVDRHVSNILSKLNVSSRAAATAFAYDHELL